MKTLGIILLVVSYLSYITFFISTTIIDDDTYYSVALTLGCATAILGVVILWF